MHPSANSKGTKMSGKISPRHDALVQQVLAEVPGSAINDLPAALRALADEIGDPGLARIYFRPDAYRINRETQELELYEVEVTSPITRGKVRQLGDLWFDWDSEGDHDWLPVLFIVDRYGHRNRVDLEDAYNRTGPFRF
jgi:hypothetical protein